MMTIDVTLKDAEGKLFVFRKIRGQLPDCAGLFLLQPEKKGPAIGYVASLKKDLFDAMIRECRATRAAPEALVCILDAEGSGSNSMVALSQVGVSLLPGFRTPFHY